MRYFIVTLLLVVSALSKAQTHHVLISTTLGDMKVELYDDTPEHRDNFMRLANSGTYDHTLFYRVVENFVIQGGSKASKQAIKGQNIGYGYTSININSEFRENRYHKKGALCAPRQPEEVNHFKKSDIAQFYIAVGRVFPEKELKYMENTINVPIKKALKAKYYTPRKPELDSLKQVDARAFNNLLRSIKDKIGAEYALSEHMEFPDDQWNDYSTIGGIPSLDGDYTVFGEVIEGIEVVDKIIAQKTDKNDRPLSDIVIKVTVID